MKDSKGNKQRKGKANEDTTVEYVTVMPATSPNNQFAEIPPLPQNPGLGPNNYSSPHQDSWCSESVGLSGPTSKYLKVIKKDNSYGFTPCMGCNRHNQMIAVAFDEIDRKFNLIVFDKDCRILATAPTGGLTKGTFGGGYWFINSHEDAVVANDDTIQCYPTSKVDDTDDVVSLNPLWISDDIVDYYGGESLYSAMPVWGQENHYWCLLAGAYDSEANEITSAAKMAVVEVVPDPTAPNGCQTTFKGVFQPQTSYNNNTFSVDENGAYFVTNTLGEVGYIIAVEFDPSTGNVSSRWVKEYESCGYLKVGQKNIGSGTTPTLTCDGTNDYVVITDNANPRMNVCVYNRNTGVLVNKTPVFAEMRSCNEASVIGVNNIIFVENNYGHTIDFPFSQYVANEPGMAAMAINSDQGSSEVIWTDDRSAFFAMTMLARESGVIFAHTADWTSDDSWKEGGMYYVDARDSYTGRIIWRIALGRGFDWCHEFGGIYFNYDNDIYIGTNKYLVSIQSVSAEEYLLNTADERVVDALRVGNSHSGSF